VDPKTLFTAPTVKVEADPKGNVCKHLRKEAKGMEGENICFEVIENTERKLNNSSRKRKIFRAKFSSITAADIRKAFSSLTVPNQNEARAVDARQVHAHCCCSAHTHSISAGVRSQSRCCIHSISDPILSGQIRQFRLPINLLWSLPNSYVTACSLYS
jgi:hypothetical protein